MNKQQPKVIPTSTNELIDKQKALSYLSNNKSNRSKREFYVDNLTKMLNEDKFLDFAETIKFDEDGKLIDGQHRLEAIVKANSTAWFVVIRNLPRDVASVIDQGQSRNVKDILEIDCANAGTSLSSIQYLNEKIAVTKKLFNGFGVLQASRATQSEMASFIKKEDILIQKFCRILDKAPNGNSKSVIIAAFVNRSILNPSTTEQLEQIAKMLTGATSSNKKDAIWKFDKWHTDAQNKVQKDKTGTITLRTSTVYAYILQAIDDQVANKNRALKPLAEVDAFTNTKYSNAKASEEN